MGNENDSLVTAPAPTELNKIHDEVFTALDKYAEAPTPEAYAPILQKVSTYKTARSKFQTDTAAFEKLQAERNKPPEKYELALPKDSILGENYPVAVAELAKKNGWTQQRAAEVLADREGTAKYVIETRKAEFQKVLQSNQEKLKQDPVLGGANLSKTEELITRLVTAFGDPDVSEPGKADYKPGTLAILKAAGATVDPGLVKFMYKIAQGMSPEKLVLPRQAVGTAARVASDAPPANFSKVAGAV